MDIYLAPNMPLQARRQANNNAHNATTTTNTTLGRKAYVRHLPPKQMDLPLRSTTFVDEEDDFPTPKAHTHLHVPPRSPGPASSCYSPLRDSTLSTHTAFEEDVYEASSDNDSEIVPFQVSDSIKKKINKVHAKSRGRVPSLIIPSPHLWPTIRRPQQSAGLPSLPSMMSPKTPLSPAALASLGSTHIRANAPSTATPSLAESLTTDEQASFSCPSTPDLRSVQGDEVEWDLPIQLAPDALDTLFHLSSEAASNGFPKADKPIVPEIMVEMKDRGLSIYDSLQFVTPDYVEDKELSPISIPSPGNFFSSLASGSAGAWCQSPDSYVPNTSTAETFYGVPWRESDSKLPQIVEADEPDNDAPLTARKVVSETRNAEDEDIDSDELWESVESYAKKLSDTAECNKSRTDIWIEAQEQYLTSLKDAALPPSETPSPQTTVSESDVQDAGAVQAKKTVRFADKESSTTDTAGGERPCDSILYHAFQHLSAHEKPRDAYIHRDSRANALRMQRTYMKSMHLCRLRGTFDLSSPMPKAKSHWLHSNNNATDEDVEAISRRETLASAGKEQRALQQLQISSWNLQAMRFLDSGSLLPQTTIDLLNTTVASGVQARVLDFGGQPTASWGWAVATAHRDVKVYTAVPSPKGISPDWLAHRGPSNHRIASVPNPWTLPFPSGMFTVISARTLHTLLRTNSFPLREGAGGDEYDATLAELHRVLAPGGVIHFSLLDAEVTAPPNSALAAKSVEFAVALRTRGYDACAGRKIVSRLETAGFVDMRRSWVSLPWTRAKGSEAGQGTEAITGLVGSVAWEQWMLKFQSEAGKPEEALLEGVAEALEDARVKALSSDGQGSGASWRMLVGTARKL